MTQDEVMELAREVGFVYYGEDYGEYNIPAPAFRSRLTLLANRVLASRKPLLASEIVTMYDENPRSDSEMIAFARAIEAAHGIGDKA